MQWIWRQLPIGCQWLSAGGGKMTHPAQRGGGGERGGGRGKSERG